MFKIEHAYYISNNHGKRETSLEEFQERDSGWALSRILNLTINVNRHNPMHAGCRIKLPEEIKTKKAVVNVQSKDNACFAWSVIATLYPAERHTERQSSYPHYTTVLNLKGIEFPVSLKQIKKFELLNDISINVYAIQEKKKKEEEKLMIVPIRRVGSITYCVNHSCKSDVLKSSRFLVFILLLAVFSPATNSPLNMVFTFTLLCLSIALRTCSSTTSRASSKSIHDDS
ncbi:hypothetical protein X777_03599 [Ooceraea biroi]|uniref:Uncharacterized protein n=1 Tax=Ooceraea biroi TaxID=2015173 RepID=A0A026VSI9_OOCBI|nr:hypothetical protein X777_03599 [Ooceraea biroi]